MTFSEIKTHLSKFRVGIAGAGGLGSNCAAALARCGVGTLVICDFDIVEESNLNRQFYFSDQVGMVKTDALNENISKISRDIKLITKNVKLDPQNIPEIYVGCDIIVEALDSSEMKEMLIETVQLKLPGVILIVGSGMAGWGKSDKLKQRKIDETLYVCGDESSEVSDSLPPLAPRVAIVANLQADKVIEILIGKKHSG